jgi:S1-C subfamily serine protease
VLIRKKLKMIQRCQCIILLMGLCLPLLTHDALATGQKDKSVVKTTQFSFSREGKSVVNIIVSNNDDPSDPAFTGTGFVWKQKKRVVTALHLVSGYKNPNIIVEYNTPFQATIKSVLPDADLVLLEIVPPPSSIKQKFPDREPIMAIASAPPKVKDEAEALGYNLDTPSFMMITLKKGAMSDPEILENMIPGKIKEELEKHTFPDLQLPIYFMNGSLLPGYSGAPIFNQQGELLGIGNGGLENGASNISWVIPASNLSRLEKSTVTQVPGSLLKTSRLFTGDREHKQNVSASLGNGFSQNLAASDKGVASGINVLADLGLLFFNLPDVNNITMFSKAHATATILADSRAGRVNGLKRLQPVDYEQFTFFKVKSRRYSEMLSSSNDPQGINKVVDLFEYIFSGYTVDPHEFMFDVYADTATGLNIILPEGVNLQVDQNQYLVAQNDEFCRTCDYGIQFYVRALSQDERYTAQTEPDKFLNERENEHLSELIAERGNMESYANFTEIKAFGNDRHVLLAAYSDLQADWERDNELNYYVAATNTAIWFEAQAIINPFTPQFLSLIKKHAGTDCRIQQSGSEKNRLCRAAVTTLKGMIAVHLTTFSNKLFDH